VRHRVEEIVVLLLLLRHWELLLRLLLRCLVRSVSVSSSSWSRCVGRRREAQLLHIFFFCGEEVEEEAKRQKMKKSRMSNVYFISMHKPKNLLLFFKFNPPISGPKKWFPAFLRDIFSKREKKDKIGRKRKFSSFLAHTPPLSYITHTSRICFKVVHSFVVHIKYFNTD